MPRKKAEVSEEASVEKTAVVNTKEESDSENWKEKYAELEKKFEKMSAMVSSLESNTADTSEKYASSAKYIRVVSLFDGTLNVGTEFNGGGKLFVFDKLGKSQKILDTDLRDIVRSNRSFAENGYFYICDKTFVEDVGLADNYNQIIGEQAFLSLCNGNRSEEALEIFKSATEQQKNNLIDVIVRKEADGELDKKFIAFFDEDGSLGISSKVKDTKNVVEAYSKK